VEKKKIIKLLLKDKKKQDMAKDLKGSNPEHTRLLKETYV